MSTEPFDDQDDDMFFEAVDEVRHPRFSDAIAERVYATYLLLSGMARVEDPNFKQHVLDLVGVVIRSIPANNQASVSKIK